MEPMQRLLLYCLAWCFSDDFLDAVTMLCVIVTFFVWRHCFVFCCVFEGLVAVVVWAKISFNVFSLLHRSV